jgi:hypothetical protein
MPDRFGEANSRIRGARGVILRKEGAPAARRAAG